MTASDRPGAPATRRRGERLSALGTPALALAASLFGAPSCSTAPVIVPVRSMERPKDVAFICLEVGADGSPRGVAIEKCRTSASGEPADEAGVALPGTVDSGRFHLHAVVTQVSRGELAVVDLGRYPNDQSDGLGLLKADPRTPGYNFLPLSEAPSGVVADPDGKAVFVASGHVPRIDIVPAELLRGPIDSRWYDLAESGKLPWPHIDFDPITEGKPGSMVIEREGGKNDRLYVVLPDTGKIAVFDLSASALAPARVGTMQPTLPKAAPLPVAPRVCLGDDGAPRAPSTLAWWQIAADATGGSCADDKTSPTAEVIESKPTTTFHLSTATLAAGKLFVADDAAPWVHVFDVAAGAGTEIARLDLGSGTSKVAVSPVVPDEVTWDNADAIEVCEANGWVGDGLDHSAQALVAAKLGGRCRAHRYVYAIDRKNGVDGDGTIAVVDLPVVKRKDGGDDIDFGGAALAQPFACDAPSFTAKRIPLAGFGVGNNLPVSHITFVQYDPPTSTGLTGVRCRPLSDGLKDKDGKAIERPDVTDIADYRPRKLAAEEWNGLLGNGNPRYLRGTFALAVLSSGAVFPIALDDRDSLCRGLLPGVRTSVANEVDFANIVRRHHPRPGRFYTAATRLSPTAPNVSRTGNVALTVNVESLPKVTVLGPVPDTDQVGKKGPFQKVDSLFALSGEDWVLTYEGEIPGFGGAVNSVGTFLQEGTDWVLLDPSAGICRKGAEAEGASTANDYLQVLDDPCTISGQCDAALATECSNTFGLRDDAELRGVSSRRDVPVKRLTDEKFVLDVDDSVAGRARGALKTADAQRLKQCFPGLTRYTLRAHKQWTVVGEATGFLHRRIIDPASPDKSCKVDTSKPAVLHGRVSELPAAPDDKLKACQAFYNTQVGLYIVAGKLEAPRDTTYRFNNKQVFVPLSLTVGSLPTAIVPLAVSRKGVDVLGWHSFAVVDANDRGLQVFSLASDLSSSLRTAN